MYNETYVWMNNWTPKRILSAATSMKNESELACENEAEDDHGNYQGLPHSNTYCNQKLKASQRPWK